MERIPLFPLGTVLLPGSQLPMRIFEPRYLRLLADLMSVPDEQRSFGVVAIRHGHEVGDGQAGELYDVGCEGLVQDVVPVSGGRPMFNLLLTGRRRFRLQQVVPDADKPYAVAEISWLDDQSPDGEDAAGGRHGSRDVERNLRAAHARYLRALQAKPAALTEDASLLAYDAADHSLLELRDKQRLLEATDAAARNLLATQLLRREIEIMTRFHAVPHQQSPGGASLN